MEKSIYMQLVTEEMKNEVLMNVEAVISGEVDYFTCDILSPSEVLSYLEAKYQIEWEWFSASDWESDVTYVTTVNEKRFFIHGSGYCGGVSVEREYEYEVDE
jgi:hypothetical protein